MIAIGRHARNSAWMVGERCLRMAVVAGVGIWVARHLGPEAFGMLSFAMAVVALATPVARAGLDGILVRELVNQPERQAELLRAGFFIRMAASLLAVLLVVAGLFLFLDGGLRDEKSLLVLLVALSLLVQPFDVLELFFQARLAAHFAAVSRAVQTLLTAAVRVGLILAGAGVAAFAGVLVLEAVVLAVALVVARRPAGAPSCLGRPPWPLVPPLLRSAWPLLLSGMAVMLYMRIDQVMIERMLGPTELGYYSAALKLSELWYGVLTVFAASLLPMVVAGAREPATTEAPGLRKIFFALIWSNVLIAATVAFAGDWIIPLVFGPAYANAVPVLAVHIWTAPFVALGLVGGNWLIARNLHVHALLRTLAGAGLNILLNLLLIPRAGITGAAVASLAAQGFSGLLVDAVSPRTRGLFRLKLLALLAPSPRQP